MMETADSTRSDGGGEAESPQHVAGCHNSNGSPSLAINANASSEDEPHNNINDELLQTSSPSSSSSSSLCCLCSTSITCVDRGHAIHVHVRRINSDKHIQAESIGSSNAAFDYDSEFDDPDVVVNVRLPITLLLLFVSMVAFSLLTDYHRPAAFTMDERIQFEDVARDVGEMHQFARLRTKEHRFPRFNGNSTRSAHGKCSEVHLRKETTALDFRFSSFLSTPSLVLGSTPTGATGVGLHVPCDWLEQRFGSEQQFENLIKEINIARVTDTDTTTRDTSPRAPLPLSTLSGKQAAVEANQTKTSPNQAAFVPTEAYQVHHILDAAGIYCRPQILRGECALIDGVSNPHANQKSQSLASEIDILRLHSWFLSLSSEATFETTPRNGLTAHTPASVSFNKLTGAVATLNCRSMVRYSAPFAKAEPASVYVEPNLNVLPSMYAQFIASKCTQETRATISQSDGEVAGVLTTSQAADPRPSETKRMKWIEPLLPLFPPVCSISLFTRPSSARSCLRNSRIIAFGDSTTQELLLQLIDFLETEDGEEPNDLTRMRVDQSTDSGSRSASSGDWMPRDAGSDGQSRYFYIEHWSPPDACYEYNALAYMTRHFTTARFPSPYLAAYNITVTMRWNVARDPCMEMRGPDRASDVNMYRATYRWLQESCLPPNAVDIANKYRRRPDGSFRTSSEYVKEVNTRFHNKVRDGEVRHTETPPPFGCVFPYLNVEESDSLSISEWPLHLDHVIGFDYAIVNMGAHYARSWGNSEAQRHEDGYSYSPAQFRHSLEAHVALVQALARHVIIRESAWRTDAKHGPAVVLINQIIRDVAVEAQTKALQRDRELLQVAALARRTNSDNAVVHVHPRRSVSWLPTFFVTAMIEKEDADHCSYKNIADREGINGIRTPYCYPIIQNIIQLMCAATSQ